MHVLQTNDRANEHFKKGAWRWQPRCGIEDKSHDQITSLPGRAADAAEHVYITRWCAHALNQQSHATQCPEVYTTIQYPCRL